MAQRLLMLCCLLAVSFGAWFLWSNYRTHPDVASANAAIDSWPQRVADGLRDVWYAARGDRLVADIKDVVHDAGQDLRDIKRDHDVARQHARDERN